MDQFRIERRQLGTFADFFPEPLHKERPIWGHTMVGTDGVWTNYRLMTGDLDGVYDTVRRTVKEYSVMRKKNPQLDMIRLFERAPHMRTTSLVYWPYAGRIDTLSRESIIAQYQDGSRLALQRDDGYGFCGIVTRSEQVFSIEKFMVDTLTRWRTAHLNFGVPFEQPQLGLNEPWRLREAAEDQLAELVQQTWTQFRNEPTEANLNMMIQVETALNSYVLQQMEWFQLLGMWEFAKRLQFPDPSTVIDMWQKDAIHDLRYDETDPWYMDEPAVPETEVTLIRRATLTDKKLRVTITTNPLMHAVSHPTLDIMHQLFTYGAHTSIGEGAENPSHKMRTKPGGRAFLGSGDRPPWPGFLPIQPAWRSIHGDSRLPEPKLRVRTRPVKVEPRHAEWLETAATSDRPVLMYLGLNGAKAPMLIMPRYFFNNVTMVPVVGSGMLYTPTEPGNTVSGWAIDSTGKDDTTRLFETAPYGFLPTPTGERPVREGALSEILPY